ncbi:hypothetical protein ORV05_15915 [Amycolatopsis cynarae]|uniref:Uncharacterized protein n=1 Tax=Amycolatopsis cynarae TaxID=2995223 RepID=A0ABY7BB33_9PSEU|nr:hypothetical protein [Amycolatopsis sp. HUAS 11-8]WAL69185.1 hypothetical protein ORV05_15915 [Amycolatopsis sp. HUAS 11-8]
MAKKRASLKNRLARHQTARDVGVVTAALRPADGDRSLAEVCWDVLNPVCRLVVSDADELAQCLTVRFHSAQATGWVAGILGAGLAYPSRADPLADPDLRALEEEVIDALGPDALWCASGDYEQSALHGRQLRGWNPVTRATFDLVVAVRGNGLDLVLARTDED